MRRGPILTTPSRSGCRAPCRWGRAAREKVCGKPGGEVTPGRGRVVARDLGGGSVALLESGEIADLGQLHLPSAGTVPIPPAPTYGGTFPGPGTGKEGR